MEEAQKRYLYIGGSLSLCSIVVTKYLSLDNLQRKEVYCGSPRTWRLASTWLLAKVRAAPQMVEDQETSET
jgi:hypothetical protein